MNWQDKFTIIKKGDTVKLIKYYDTCRTKECCNSSGYYIGQTYKVTYITQGQYQLDGKCQFPRECIQKVLI